MAFDDQVEISPDGTLRPLGETARGRLLAREGRFRVLPAPANLLMLRRESGDEPARPCVLAGELSSAGILCDVLSFIGQMGWRGELIVQERDSTRSIFFDQGDVVGARSSVLNERLGEVLYRDGALTREQVEICAAAGASGELRFGEVAVKNGYITREVLFGLMTRQTEETFYGMLLVGEAAFYFLGGFDNRELWARQKLPLPGLLREGIRRMHETRYFRARIPTERHVPAPVQGRPPLPEGDLATTYRALNGVRSVVDVCRTLKRSEFDVTRALFQLVQSGHVVVLPPKIDAAGATEAYNHAIALILRELDAMDEGDTVREQLVAFAAQRPALAAVFGAVPPADDGTLDAARVAAMVPVGAEEQLASSLYDYVSYALFLARPHLARQSAGPQRPRLSARVGEMLSPIAPAGAGKPPRKAP